MRIDVLMPKMGESITEGRILKWVKKAGDHVDKDESILEIATDKVDTEVPSPSAGILVEVHAAEGETIDVGKVVAVIESDASIAVPVAGIQAPAEQSAPVAVAAPVAPQTAPVTATPLTAQTTPVAATAKPSHAAVSTGGAQRFYSPVVMRLATESGIGFDELERVQGTGSNGRVSKADLLAYVASRGPAGAANPAANAGPASPGSAAPIRVPAGSGVSVVPMTNMQRLMAEHMVESKRISPHVALASEVDMTAVVRFRDRHADAFKVREGISLTFMPFVAEAVIRALKDFPLVNSSIDGGSVLLKNFVNLGIAVALEDGGLIVPVVKGADALNIVGLARGIADVAGRARKKRLQPEEIQDGTFTITNFGVFGNVWGIPIINQPQVAILGVGSLQKKPVVIERDGEDVIAIRSMMTLSLSFDHRIVDGAMGGQFLGRIARYLEDFHLDAI